MALRALSEPEADIDERVDQVLEERSPTLIVGAAPVEGRCAQERHPALRTKDTCINEDSHYQTETLDCAT